YFAREVSPFFGLEENSARNFQVLYDMVPHNGPVLFVTNHQMEIPVQWKVQRLISGIQMVHYGEAKTEGTQPALVPLTDEHIPQMLALTKLTNPGPFAERTIDFGHYYGVFDGDKLVAMAGQRLYPGNYAEISAVCTHPDYLSRGYARQLLLQQVQR